MKRDLKPCPFCGHDKPEFHGTSIDGKYVTRGYIRCPKCLVSLPGVALCIGGREDIENEELSNHALVNAWNKRAGEEDGDIHE